MRGEEALTLSESVRKDVLGEPQQGIGEFTRDLEIRAVGWISKDERKILLHVGQKLGG